MQDVDECMEEIKSNHSLADAPSNSGSSKLPNKDEPKVGERKEVEKERMTASGSLSRIENIPATSLSALRLSTRTSLTPLSSLPGIPIVNAKGGAVDNSVVFQERDEMIDQMNAEGEARIKNSSLSIHNDEIESVSDFDSSDLDEVLDESEKKGTINLRDDKVNSDSKDNTLIDQAEPKDKAIDETSEIIIEAHAEAKTSTAEANLESEPRATAPITLVYSDDNEDWEAEDVESLDLSDLDDTGEQNGFPKSKKHDDNMQSAETSSWMKPVDSKDDGGMNMLGQETPVVNADDVDISEAEYLMDDFAGDTDTDEENGKHDGEIIVDDFLDDGAISYVWE